MSNKKKTGAAERVFRSLLKLLPFDFRSDYGRELEQVFREQRRDAGEGSKLAPIRLWSKTIGGVFSTALSEHLAIFGRDARYGMRTLRASPTFTIAVVLTLMIGIGANTAIFSVVNRVLLQSLPYEEPDRLVRVYESNNGIIDEAGGYLTGPDFVDFRDSGIFDDLATAYIYQDTGFDLSGDGVPLRVSSLRISSGFFEVLGIDPLLGRTFSRQEETGGPLVILSEGLWRRRFGGSPDVLGRPIVLDANPYEVVGVMPRGTKGPIGTDPDLWVPENLQPGGSNHRGNHYLSAVGRLKEGTGLVGTQSELERFATGLAAQYESNEGRSGRLIPLHEDLIGNSRPMLYVMLGAVGLVLLIGCANVANLFLARASNRERELAIRTALGSGRARLVRQLLTENVILAAVGGVGGLAVAWIGVRLLLAIGPNSLPFGDTVVFDRQVFAFAAGLSLATGFLFGLVPALHASRPNLNGFLATGGARSSTGKRQQRFRATFVLAQVALALILVVGAGLLIRSFNGLAAVELGFRTDQVITFAINLPNGRYGEPEQRTAFCRTFYEQVGALPGIDSAGAISKLPASGRYHIWGFRIVGREEADENQGFGLANIRCVDVRYFDSLGITLLEGRLLDDRDRTDSASVVVVNSALGQKYFPDGETIGQSVRVDGANRTTVGIVADTRHDHFEPADPKIYIPHPQFVDNRNWAMTQAVRSTLPTGELLAGVGGVLTSIDPELVTYDVRTLEDVAGAGIARQRFAMVLMGIFSTVAMLLAATGIYGVIAYSVSQRMKEIGIRKALGAQESNLWRWIMVQGLVPVVGGIGLGIAGAYWLGRYLSSLVFEVSATDPATLVTSVLGLAAVALAAGAYPAWAASRTDPNMVLRGE